MTRLLWDGRGREFDLDKLEITWLVYQEEVEKSTEGITKASLNTIVRLKEEFKFGPEAIQYVVAIKSELWKPS